MKNFRLIIILLLTILLSSTVAFGTSIPLGPYFDDTYFDLSDSALILKVISHEKGGLEADVSAYDGLLKISGGATSAVTDNSSNWDTAYGWGDWSGEGFISDITGESLFDLSDVPADPNADRYLMWDDAPTGELVWAEVGGYTNLTSFVAQTAWCLFYSNTDGDVTEIALGADGTYLRSNGATSAPTFGTPTGAGDMLKATYDTDTDSIVDKAETVDDGVNSATAADIEDAVTKKHTQNTDTITSIAGSLDDHTYKGKTDIKNVGENVVFGDLLYFDWTQTEWMKAKADAYATARSRRIALETKANGEACLMLVTGYIRDDSAFEFTTATVFLSITTAGATQSTVPSVAGNQIQIVGTAISADIMEYSPSIDVGEI